MVLKELFTLIKDLRAIFTGGTKVQKHELLESFILDLDINTTLLKAETVKTNILAKILELRNKAHRNYNQRLGNVYGQVYLGRTGGNIWEDASHLSTNDLTGALASGLDSSAKDFALGRAQEKGYYTGENNG